MDLQANQRPEQSSHPRLQHSVDTLRQLFYRSRFSQVVQTVNQMALKNSDRKTVESLMIKANALYELHQVGEAKSLLSDLNCEINQQCPKLVYSKARIQYFLGNHESAKILFSKAVTEAIELETLIKSLLGLANVHYSLGDKKLTLKYLKELEASEPLTHPEDRICLFLANANYESKLNGNPSRANMLLTKALQESSKESWSYFYYRSLYGLAGLALTENKHHELTAILKILRASIEDSESTFLSFMINEKFKDSKFTINTHLEFDPFNLRILIKNTWLAFHDKPALYNFLQVLHNKRTFVSKEEIAQNLWQKEDYKPRVHDPRIFDLAKRARSIIESYENQPVVLLSGRLGYKLASL